MKTDKELIISFVRGNEFSFVAIYNRHRQSVFSFSLKMLRSEAEAEDVLQETFLKAYEYKYRLEEIESLKAWLFTIARNKCLNRIRQRKSRNHLRLDSAIDLPSTSPDLNRLEKYELVERVNNALEQLSPDYKEVIVLREYQNMSYDEICVVTDSSLNAVKSRLFKARKKLGSILQHSAVEFSEVKKDA